MAGPNLILWLHGLGDTGSGWHSLQYDLKADFPKTKFQFPTAPNSPVTCNGGMKMTSWFDLQDIPITPNTPDFADDYWSSVAIIHGKTAFLLHHMFLEVYAPAGMVDDVIAKGVAPESIVIGGFSQGDLHRRHAPMPFTDPSHDRWCTQPRSHTKLPKKTRRRCLLLRVDCGCS